jgi:hypothetical protein
MAQATDWQNISGQMRDILALLAQNDSTLSELENFYFKNQGDAYWAGLQDGDLIGVSGITKAQFVSAIVFISAFNAFLDNGTPAQGDYRATVEQVRSTD